MQQEKERKNQAIEQVRMECFMCDKYLHVDIMKTKKETEKKKRNVSIFTRQLVVAHTLLDDDNNLMMMEQKLFVVIVMHNKHLMLLDYHQNLVA